MTYEQITNLLDRGFTPDQITMLTTSVTPTQTEEPTEPVEDKANPLAESSTDSPTGEEQKEAAAEEAPSAAPAEDKNKEVLAAIADLKKAVQANNIKTMSVEGVDSEAALEKAMSELIRPSFEKGEKQ